MQLQVHLCHLGWLLAFLSSDDDGNFDFDLPYPNKSAAYPNTYPNTPILDLFKNAGNCGISKEKRHLATNRKVPLSGG